MYECIYKKYKICEYNVIEFGHVFLFQYGAGAVHYTITHYQDDKQELLRMLIDNGAHVNLTDHVRPDLLNFNKD